MTQEEGNKLIAEFMELYLDEKCQYADWDGMHEAKYHSSWDWLMPVVEKITNTSVSEGFPVIEGDVSVFTIKIGRSIQTVWEAVVSFIQWYNTTKK